MITVKDCGDYFRVRDHIRTLQDKIEEELKKPKLDTKALRELSDTLAKFELVEQKLSGRASPGALRPRSRNKRDALRREKKLFVWMPARLGVANKSV